MNTRSFVQYILIFLFCAGCSLLKAQEIDFAGENAGYNFPETLTLRNALKELESSRAATAAHRQTLDSINALYDSVAHSAAPYAGYTMFLKGNADLSAEASALLRTCATRAKILYDSLLMLRSLRIQRQVVRVDSIRGIVDLIPLADQKIYRLHCTDSTEQFVQLDTTLNIGDTISAYAVRFGRKIFPSSAQPGTWEMSEGTQATAGDSVFDVLRQVAKPHIYDVYSAFTARFDTLHSANEPPLDSALLALHAQLQSDLHAAEKHITELDDSIQTATRQLWGKNLLLSAQHSIGAGNYLSAVDILLRMRSADSGFIGIAEATLAQARKDLDSVSRIQYFGSDGLKNMTLVPGGSVTLHTGERFEPEAFYMDASAVTNEEFNAFEKSTGYKAVGNWRAGYTTPSQSQDAVQNLSLDDKTAFARWANKRPATPQEIEYVAASGFPALSDRNAHPKIANVYGVSIISEGFYCAHDLSSFPQSEQERLKQQAEQHAREIKKIIDAAGQ
ncbi:MAG TPA: SUMF1/EgtB/PvdO family nonheme iron enzyme [Candidatus Kapabacteria bacterium]|nr:SUMF1/EgtB/PvdO family nonheme iron enzyme [Candidatus Kapabacteria bacterium]